MPEPKYNWKVLEEEYIKGKYLNLKTFAKEKKIGIKALYKHSQDWGKSIEKVKEKADDKLADKIAAMKIKHLDLADNLIEKGKAIMRGLEFDNGYQGAVIIAKGIEIERSILDPKESDDKIITIILDGAPRPKIKAGESKKN